MHIKFLVGKNAIRTKEAKTRNGLDGSYMNESLKIIKVTDHHIVTESKSIFHEDKTRQHILDYHWIDENWADYDELMDGIKKDTE